MTSFVYSEALLGGVLIGVATTGLVYSHGRFAGISGILAGALSPSGRYGQWGWRAAFLLGLVLSGVVVRLVRPEWLAEGPVTHPLTLVVAGVLAGLGARIGGGCTSGHGICGIGRLSLRSVVATALFIAVGALAVAAGRFASGG